MACGTPPAASTQGTSASRLRIVSRTSSRNVTSAAARTAAASAWPSGLSGSAAACSITPRLSSSSSCASVGSSSTSKRAATLASNGNRCRSCVQKAWMVCTLRPPGVSSASANSCRARRRSAAEGRATPAACIAASRPASSSRVHLRSSSNTRFAMLAAAALVKVMQRMRAGIDAGQQQPDHALRQHMGLAGAGVGRDKGGMAGSDASICRSVTAGGISRGALIRRLRRCHCRRRRRSATIP